MSDAERIKAAIRDIARRPKNVTAEEIERVINQLKKFHHEVRVRRARHGVLYGVDNQRFMVNSHNPGGKQVTAYSVAHFIDAMAELGWYEE